MRIYTKNRRQIGTPKGFFASASARDLKSVTKYNELHSKSGSEALCPPHFNRLDPTPLTALTCIVFFSEVGQMKTKSYESDTFMQEMEDTWQGLKPLYEQVTKIKYL